MVQVEVVYAAPERQRLCLLDVPPGTTARQAALASKLSAEFAEVDLSTCALGIFGKRLQNPESHVLQGGERVEIYRPLSADPKDVRRRRAARSAA